MCSTAGPLDLPKEDKVLKVMVVGLRGMKPVTVRGRGWQGERWASGQEGGWLAGAWEAAHHHLLLHRLLSGSATRNRMAPRTQTPFGISAKKIYLESPTRPYVEIDAGEPGSKAVTSKLREKLKVCFGRSLLRS